MLMQKVFAVTFILGFPGGAVVKNLPVNVGDMGSSLGQEEPLD